MEVPVVLLNHQQMKWRNAFKQKWKGLRCGIKVLVMVSVLSLLGLRFGL